MKKRDEERNLNNLIYWRVVGALVATVLITLLCPCSLSVNVQILDGAMNRPGLSY